MAIMPPELHQQQPLLPAHAIVVAVASPRPRSKAKQRNTILFISISLSALHCRVVIVAPGFWPNHRPYFYFIGFPDYDDSTPSN